MLNEAEIDANLALLCGEEDHADWETLQSRRRKLRIMDAFCSGCGSCLTACSEQGISLVDGKAMVDETRCILCGYCAAACPDFIIRVN
jgi:heterodisulfide reductase subunit A-like polyferredoxin